MLRPLDRQHRFSPIVVANEGNIVWSTTSFQGASTENGSRRTRDAIEWKQRVQRTREKGSQLNSTFEKKKKRGQQRAKISSPFSFSICSSVVSLFASRGVEIVGNTINERKYCSQIKFKSHACKTAVN